MRLTGKRKPTSVAAAGVQMTSTCPASSCVLSTFAPVERYRLGLRLRLGSYCMIIPHTGDIHLNHFQLISMMAPLGNLDTSAKTVTLPAHRSAAAPAALRPQTPAVHPACAAAWTAPRCSCAARAVAP